MLPDVTEAVRNRERRMDIKDMTFKRQKTVVLQLHHLAVLIYIKYNRRRTWGFAAIVQRRLASHARAAGWAAHCALSRLVRAFVSATCTTSESDDAMRSNKASSCTAAAAAATAPTRITESPSAGPIDATTPG